MARRAFTRSPNVMARTASPLSLNYSPNFWLMERPLRTKIGPMHAGNLAIGLLAIGYQEMRDAGGSILV